MEGPAKRPSLSSTAAAQATPYGRHSLEPTTGSAPTHSSLTVDTQPPRPGGAPAAPKPLFGKVHATNDLERATSSRFRTAPRRRSSAARMHDLATPTFIETMREKDMRMSRWSLVFADQFVEVQYRKWMLLHRHTSVTIFWLTAAVVYGVLLLAFDLITWRPTDADPSTGWGVVWTVCTLQFVLVSIRWCLLCQRDSTYRANLSLLLFSTTLFGCGSIVARWGLHSASLQEFPLTSFASGIGDVVAFMVLLASPNLSPFTFHHHAILVVVMGVCRLVLVSMSIAGADWMASGVTDSAADEVVGSTVISLVASTLVIIVVAYRHDMKHRDSFSEQWWDLVEKELANKSAPTDQLSALTDTIRTGQLRALYVKAMTNSKGSASAKLKLHSFVHNTREVLQGLDAGDHRARGLLTAANAVSVADQWLQRIRQIENGSIHVNNECQVFLGGSCNPTTWRMDTAIPLLKQSRVTYYNPQVEDWSEELIELENKAKAQASVLLFVIDGLTRAIVSMNEVTELICRGRRVVLVVQDIQEGVKIQGTLLATRERKDLNRGRAYLRDLARRYAAPLFDTVPEAVQHITNMFASSAFGEISATQPLGAVFRSPSSRLTS